MNERNPRDYGEGKSSAQETRDSMFILACGFLLMLVFLVVVIALIVVRS